MVETLISIGRGRLLTAASHWPGVNDWLFTALLLVAYGIVAIPFGLKLGLLKLEIVTKWKSIITNLAIALIFPSIFEEVLFRVLLLPSPEETTLTSNIFLWIGLVLTIFVVAHPLNALTFFPNRKATFFDPTFLLLAGLLGFICTIAYWQSASLWPPVILHWLIVIIWLLCLGGEKRMAG